MSRLFHAPANLPKTAPPVNAKTLLTPSPQNSTLNPVLPICVSQPIRRSYLPAHTGNESRPGSAGILSGRLFAGVVYGARQAVKAWKRWFDSNRSR